MKLRKPIAKGDVFCDEYGDAYVVDRVTISNTTDDKPCLLAVVEMSIITPFVGMALRLRRHGSHRINSTVYTVYSVEPSNTIQDRPAYALRLVRGEVNEV